MTNVQMEDRHPCLSRPRGILPLANHEHDKLEAYRPSQARSLTSSSFGFRHYFEFGFVIRHLADG
jgi:hypothetical protein